MPAAALPANEHSRLAMLESLGILDTAPEDDYDDIVRIAAAVCGVPTAMISLVDARRQWFKARLGMEQAQMPRETSLCAHAILEPEQVLVVPDTREDARFADNALTTEGAVRFYAGAPVLADGVPIGTVCVLDSAPRALEAQQVEVLHALSRQVSRMIELRKAGRLLKLHLREREWYQQQLAAQERPTEPEAVRQGAIPDVLRGLPDRAAFMHALAEALQAGDEDQGEGEGLQVALFEVDGLDALTDIHGADEAQSTLRAVARTLRSGEVAEGRLAWLDPHFALLMAMPLSQAVAQCRVLGERVGDPAAGIPITLSIGVARAEPGETAADVLETAEHALAQVRGAGGNGLEVR